MLTGSMVLIWTLGAEDERSRWPNWLRWSSSLGRKLGGMGMDLDGDTVVWHIDLEGRNLSVKMSLYSCLCTFTLFALTSREKKQTPATVMCGWSEKTPDHPHWVVEKVH